MSAMATTTLGVKRLSGVLGAEIDGVDLSGHLEPEPVAAIRAAWIEHHVLVFRNQSLTHDEQVRFAASMGEIQVHPFVQSGPDHPQVMELIVEADDETNFGGGWHTDLTCLEAPVLGSILYAVELPEVGGDTLFANQQAAYDALSEAMKSIVDGLGAVHSAGSQYGSTGVAIDHKSMKTGNHDAAVAEVVHPVVRTHPESGRKGLFINSAYVTEIVGFTRPESDALLSFLFRHAVEERFTCRVSWEPGTVVMWDNRSVQHQALHDYAGERRHMRRVTVRGDRPV